MTDDTTTKRVCRNGRMPEAEELRDAARSVSMILLQSLAEIVKSGKNEAARVSAAKELLDRGWGRSHIIPSGELRPQAKIEVSFPDEDKNA